MYQKWLRAPFVCLLTLLANGPRSEGSNLDMLEERKWEGEEEEAVWNCFLYLVELVQLLLPSSYVEVDCYMFLVESQPYLKFF